MDGGELRLERDPRQPKLVELTAERVTFGFDAIAVADGVVGSGCEGLDLFQARRQPSKVDRRRALLGLEITAATVVLLGDHFAIYTQELVDDLFASRDRADPA